VTGSLIHGSMAAGDEVVIYPRGLRARVRHIQVHNRQEDRVVAGHRVALNLSGIGREQIRRGDTISTEGAFEVTHRLDVKVRTVGTDLIVKDWTRVRLYLGSAELLARLVVLTDKKIRSGQEVFCQLRLESPAVAWMGDRCILRLYSPPGLLGGGRVLHPVPPKHKRFDPAVIERFGARDAGDLKEIIVTALSSGPLRRETLNHSLRWTAEEIRTVAGELQEAGRIRIMGSFFILPQDLDRIEERAVKLVGDFHRRQPLKKGISKEELKSRIEAPNSLMEEMLSASEQLRLDGDLVRQRDQGVQFSAEQEKERQRIETAFLKADLSPPDREAVLGEFDAEVFYALVEQGLIVPLTKDIYLHRQTLEKAQERIGKALSERGPMRLGEMKDLWGTTRKFAVPLAEYLDRIGFTQRSGDKRSLADTA